MRLPRKHTPSPLSCSLARFSSIAAITAALTLAATKHAEAQFTWDAGSSANFNWDDVRNWPGDVSKPVATDNVVFPTPIPNPGALANPNVIALTAGELANSLTFNAGYILSGGTLALSTGNPNSGVVTIAAGTTATIGSALTGAGSLIAKGAAATGVLNLSGNNTAWTGALQVDPNAVVFASVGFGTGGNTSLPSGDLTLNGGRLALTPSIGTGLAVTPGLVGRWVNYGTTAVNDTFATAWFANTAATRIDSTVNFPILATVDPTTGLSTTNGLPPGVGIPNGNTYDRYAVVYNGLLNITNGGSYTFFIPSDDGSSLFIDGKQVGVNEGGHGLAGGGATTGAVSLSAGPHQITLKNTNGGTGGGIQLAYQGPDQTTAPTPAGLNPISNMATVGVPAAALSNTAPLTKTLTNTITVPAQAAATNTTLENSGFDVVSNGAMSVGDNGTLIFGSATSHTFTQAGPVTLGANSGLSSVGQATTVPLATTLTPANVIVNGNVTLNGNANMNADTSGALTVNGAITDGAGTFGITKFSTGTLTFGGTAANTVDGPVTIVQGTLLLNKTAGTNAIGAGGLQVNTTSVPNTGFTAGVNFAVARLLASDQIADTATLTVQTHPTVGYGATFDMNNFNETVGGLVMFGATANQGLVRMGTGTLTVNGDITMNNSRNATGNTGREVLITGTGGNAAATAAPGSGTLNLGGATRNITTNTNVTQADNNSSIDSIITNGGITKLGTQRLILNGSDPANARNSTFAGGVTLTNGVLRGAGANAATSSVFGTGALTINTGLTVASGGIAAGLATLELRNGGAMVNVAQGGTAGTLGISNVARNPVVFGNNVNVTAAAGATFGVDVNGGSTNSAAMAMGTLTTPGALTLNVTGAGNSILRFEGIALGGALTLNPTTAHVQLNNLSGANNIIKNGAGDLILGGNGAGFTGNVNVTAGTLRLAVPVNGAGNVIAPVLGAGSLTLPAAPVLGIIPTISGNPLVAGTPGGLTAKFYQTNAAQTLSTTGAFATIPSGVMTSSMVSDGAITNRPPVVTGTSFTNDVVVYTGLLNITSGGNYTFQTYVDDESQLVVDGFPLISVNFAGGGTGVVHSPVSPVIALNAGLHTIAMKVSNQGGGGGVGLLYNGADSGNVMRIIPSTALQVAVPYSNVANSGVDQAIAAAGTLTLDGGGTDLDGGINNLDFAGATGTLNVTNVSGTGAITVSGVTSFGANTPTFNPTTGVLALLGDVTGSGAITKTGAGAMVLAGAKTFTGALAINVGGVQITNPNSLGTTAGATTVASGGVLDLNGVALNAEPLTLNGAGVANISPAALWNSSSSPASASGPITLATAATVGGFGDITLSGDIGGTLVLSKVGGNTLTLSGANTTTGGITVSQGVLKVGSAGALGTVAGTTTVAAGAVLDLNGFSLGEPLNITGAGLTNFGPINSLGGLINTGAAVTQSGGIVLGGAASIGSNSLGAGGDITVSGVISGGQALTKVGGNTLTLTGVNTYTGATTVNLGTLLLNGGGTIATQGSLTANPKSVVTLDNSVTNVNNRLGAHGVTLVGANLNIIGNATAATTEALGANNLATTSGQAVITLTPDPAQSLTLSSTNALARNNNGTILIRGTNLGAAAGAGVATVTFGATPQTVGQFGAAGSKNRAIIPWAVVDTSATGDGSSFAASGAGGLLQPLNQATDYDVNTITGPNNILLAPGTTNAPAGRTLINSITMAGGTLNVGAGNTLDIDSGAVGAGATGTISGGRLNAGIAQNNYLREFVVYTSGAGTNLTINSVMDASVNGQNASGPNTSTNILNRAGLTKAGLGTLTLGAQNTFVGTTRLNGGTTVLAGGNNTLFYPAATPPAPGGLGSTITGQALVIDPGATLNLNGNNQRVGSYASNGAAGSSALPGTYGTITNTSATASTLRISQAANFTTPSSIAGNVNVQRDGGFTLTLTSPNTYTGTTVINGGQTKLQDGATLSGTSSITLNRAALNIDDSQLQLVPNRISSTVPITLNGGALTFIGRGGGTQNVYSIGQGTGSLTVGTGSGVLVQTMAGNANANGAGSAQLTVGNIVHTAPGATLGFSIAQANAQAVGDNPRFYVSQINGAAVTPSTMLPAWITTVGQNPASAIGGTSGTINNIQALSIDFAQYDAATGVRAAFYTSSFAPGNIVNLGSATTLPVGGTTIQALRLGNGAFTVTFPNAGAETLNLQSGGLISSNDNSARALGNSANAGNLTAGGVNPGGPRELYIYNGANTLTLNTRIINNPTDGSVVSPVFSAASQSATIQLNGSNTYTGTTYVNGVTLNLNAPAGGVAIPGDLIAGGGTSNGGDSQNPASQIIRFSASNQIAPTATVTLNGGYLLDLNNQSGSIANLVFGADGGSFGNQGPAVQTGSGTLTLTGNVTATNLQQATTIPSMQGNLALAAGAHTFNVGVFPDAPGEIGLALNSTLSGTGTITKTGAGVLGLGGNSASYTGALDITAGSAQISANNANLSGTVVTINPGTTLNAGGFVGTVGQLAGTGTVTSTASTVAAFGGQLNVGANNVNSTFGGLVTGVVTIGKVGTGTFSLTNVANDYSGGTLVNDGTLNLAGAGLTTTGSGAITVVSGGTLAGAGVVPGGLKLNPASTVNFSLPNTPGAALISTGSGSISSSGPTTINITGTPGVGTYPLIDYGGGALNAGQLAGIKLGTTPGGAVLYGLVNNAANTSIDLRVETAGASNSWTGATNGVWDMSTSNWSGGTFANGNQVTFPNAAANKVISGPAVSPQTITVTNSNGNDYSIANAIGGALAGGLTKNGDADLRLTGANTFGGPINVNGGTVRASVASGTNGLGSGSVALADGTTLRLDPVANTSTPGITGRYFHQITQNSSLPQQDFESPAVAIQTDPGVNITWTTTNRPAGGLVGENQPNSTSWQNFGAQWIGKVNIPAAGPWSFFTNSDDATRVFIDGVLVSSLDGGRGNTEDGGVINLTRGLHDVRFEFLQGNGGAQAGLSWQGPGVPKAFIPAASLFTAENIADGRANNNILAGNNITLSGTGTINLSGRNFTGVQIGGLTTPTGSTLNVTGDKGKLLRAAGTFLSGGTVTYNTVADLAPGQISDGGSATTIIKQGAGRLVLDNTELPATGLDSSLVSGTVFDVRDGKLIARGYNGPAGGGGTNPLGAAQVRLNGGGLLLDTKQNAVTFNNAVTVSQNATIEVLPNADVLAPQVITTLGGSNGIALAGGSTLTFDVYGGARAGNATNSNTSTNGTGAALVVAGAITGTGHLAFTSSQFNQEQYPIFGTATLNANNTFAGTTTLNGGVAFQGTNNLSPNNNPPYIITLNGQGRLSGSTGITINQAQLSVDDSATVNTGRINATAPLNLNSGTLHLLASTGANSGETFGPITSNTGLNRIVIVNTPGAGLTGVVTGSSLVRNNRSTFAFQGIALGGTTPGTAAAAADLVRFTTAPALVGGGGAAATTTISILPYAVGTSNPGTNPPTYMPVTYETTGGIINGIRPITAAETTTVDAAPATNNGNTRNSIAAAAAPVPSVNTVNSWVLDNSSNAAQTATLTTNPVTFTSTGAGLMLLTATNATQGALTVTGTAINFQGAEGNIFVTNTAGATISSVIQGTNGITVSGANNNINTNVLGTTPTLGGALTLTAANTYTGVTTINGTVIVNNGTGDTPLGDPANGVNFGSGTLRFNNANSILAATRTVTMLPNAFGIIDTTAGNQTIAGPITGSGGLIKINGNTLTLSAANSDYSGQTTVFAGNLVTTTGPQGDLLLAGLGNVSFTQAASGQYTGDITGIGSVTVNASGQTITLGDPADATKGVNAYGGGTTVTTGTTLRGTTSSLVGGITNPTMVTFEQSFNGIANAVISGAGSLTKLGPGAVTMVNDQTYTGTTDVSAGTLIVDGSITGATVTVSTGAILGGSGTITSPVLVAGTLAPGSSAGQLDTGALTLQAGSTFAVELNGTQAGEDYDQVNTTGTITLGGGNITLSLGYTPQLSDKFFVALNDGSDPVSGTFAGLPEGSFVTSTGGYAFFISYVGNGDAGAVGNDIVLSIPEPGSFVSLIGGMGLLCGLQRFRRRRE